MAARVKMLVRRNRSDPFLPPIVGGADAGVFSIDATNHLVLTDGVIDANDPTDADGDGVYEVTVCVTDAAALSFDQDFDITIGP